MSQFSRNHSILSRLLNIIVLSIISHESPDGLRGKFFKENILTCKDHLSATYWITVRTQICIYHLGKCFDLRNMFRRTDGSSFGSRLRTGLLGTWRWLVVKISKVELGVWGGWVDRSTLGGGWTSWWMVKDLGVAWWLEHCSWLLDVWSPGFLQLQLSRARALIFD